MEEAEALCSKITIQVDGQLRCFGSSQHVKSRYGSGYEVPVKFKAVTEEQRKVEPYRLLTCCEDPKQRSCPST
jgi:ABC-type multidrug transport system ATPase subunit